MWLVSAVICAAIGMAGGEPILAQGVRVVDAVNLAAAREETAHGLNGEEMTVGETEGRTWRSAAGWFGYTLRIYEDSPLTIACAFTEAATLREAFDILVDDRRVATLIREAGASAAADYRITLPFAETAGKSGVTVTFRAHAGSRTARLLEVRTVQEHLERPPAWSQNVSTRPARNSLSGPNR
jgi:hypothetical protein